MIDVPNYDELSVSNLWPHLKNDKALSAEDHTVFRALAARANYLAEDRID